MLDTFQIIQSIIYAVALYYVVFWLLVLLEGNGEAKSRKKLREYPFVTIAVPAYNEEDNIEETLDSIFALDYPKEKLSIIVVDDGSKDKTYELAKKYAEAARRKHKPKSFLVLTQKNQGKFMALNNAIKHTTTEFFAVLDADSIPKPDALKKLMSCFEEDVAAVSPVLKVYKPRNHWQKMQWFEYSVNHFYRGLIARLNAMHVTPGPLSVYRSEVIKKLGGFREAHKVEDMEIAIRIQKKNYRIMQCDDAFVYTKAPSSLREWYRQRHRWNYGTLKNVIDYRSMMFNRKYGDFGFFQLPIIMLSGALGVAVLGLILHSIWKAAKPFFQNLSMYNFNIIEYFSNVKLNIIWLDINMRSLAFMLGFFILSLFVMWLSLKLYKNKHPLKKITSFIMYLFFYYLLIAIVWAGVYKDVLLHKKTSWKR
jgi:cellulose synthase/poly-beta-1,6-N-acetylglucosamine synthase-like glycosyltransferase